LEPLVPANARSRTPSQLVYSLIIGVAIAVLAALGMRALYPPPLQNQAQLTRLTAEQAALDASAKLSGKMAGAHKAYYQKVASQLAARKKALESGISTWRTTTTVALVGLGVLLMCLSLIPAAKLGLFMDAAFFCGLCTAWYGVYGSFAAGSSATSYVALAVAAVVTLVVGYLQFVGVSGPRARDSASAEPSTSSELTA
jgi:hypothetical protein